MLNKEELKMSLKLYKDSLGPERYKVKPSARVPVEVGQIRVLFWRGCSKTPLPGPSPNL